MSSVLPPDVSASTFAHALRDFTGVVGKEWVLLSPEDRDSYLDPYAPGDPGEFAACGALSPTTVEQIQGIVRIASRYRIPLWPVSTGKNLTYGGAAPRLRGTMVLDLKRMNRILEVNEQLGYALVEPGVSYFDLYEYIRSRGLKLWIDCPAPGWGSVLGNTLERGYGATPYADHVSTQCGMEVVLASGDVLRTGTGAMTGNPTWQLSKYAFGPSMDNLFMQSNFGIVTKMGTWLMPAPQHYMPCNVKFANESDLEAAIDVIRELKLSGVVQAPITIMNWLRAVHARTTRSEWYAGTGAIPEGRIAEIIKATNTARWTASFAFYGTAEINELGFAIARRAFERIPGVAIERRSYAAGERIAPADGMQAGIPSLAGFQGMNWYGGAGAHLDFSPIVPPIGSIAARLYRSNRSRFEAVGMDYPCGFATIGARCMTNISPIIYDTSDPSQTARARRLFATLMEDAAREGYSEYRAHLAFMDEVAQRYDFNNHVMLRLSETIKDALDPVGILAPGKQGIWPKALRRKHVTTP